MTFRFRHSSIDIAYVKPTGLGSAHFSGRGFGTLSTSNTVVSVQDFDIGLQWKMIRWFSGQKLQCGVSRNTEYSNFYEAVNNEKSGLSKGESEIDILASDDYNRVLCSRRRQD
ncbi:hypothetical protein AB6A40_006040 [Gnathostoma spinigerum]|uniref:Uncharacterized protein n=1 Tax=Gnathostoma spinigerum TaxID=75299 RepID=A0ABD6EPH6_9BILA